METRIRKLINARAKAIQAFQRDVDTKCVLFFEYIFALYEAGLITRDELVKLNSKPRFYDEDDKALRD